MEHGNIFTVTKMANDINRLSYIWMPGLLREAYKIEQLGIVGIANHGRAECYAFSGFQLNIPLRKNTGTVKN